MMAGLIRTSWTTQHLRLERLARHQMTMNTLEKCCRPQDSAPETDGAKLKLRRASERYL